MGSWGELYLGCEGLSISVFQFFSLSVGQNFNGLMAKLLKYCLTEYLSSQLDVMLYN
jgi:hypothetical protein